MVVLGIDPGSEGAATILDDAVPARPILSAHWVTDGDWAKVEVAWAPNWRLVRTSCPSWAVGSEVQRFAAEVPGANPRAIVIEGAYVGVDATAAIHVARSGGTVSASYATAEYLAGREPRIRVVGANPWRAKIGVVARRGEDKKTAALRIVPLLVPGIVAVGRVLGLSSHLVDSCGVALCGLRLRAWEGEPAEWQARAGGGTSTARRAKRAAAKAVADTTRTARPSRRTGEVE